MIGLDITGLDEVPTVENGWQPYTRYNQLLKQGLIDWQLNDFSVKQTDTFGPVPRMFIEKTNLARKDNSPTSHGDIILDGKYARIVFGSHSSLVTQDFVGTYVVTVTYGGVMHQITIMLNQEASLEIVSNPTLTVYPNGTGYIDVEVLPLGAPVTRWASTTAYLDMLPDPQTGFVNMVGQWSCATAGRYLPPGVQYEVPGWDGDKNPYTDVGDGTPKGCYEEGGRHRLHVKAKDVMQGGNTNLEFTSGGFKRMATVILSTDYIFTPVISNVIRGKPGDTGRFYFNVQPEDDTVWIYQGTGTVVSHHSGEGIFNTVYFNDNRNRLIDIKDLERTNTNIVGQNREFTLMTGKAENGFRYFDYQLKKDGVGEIVFASATNEMLRPERRMKVQVFCYYDDLPIDLVIKDGTGNDQRFVYGQAATAETFKSRIDYVNGIIYIADGERFSVTYTLNDKDGASAVIKKQSGSGTGGFNINSIVGILPDKDSKIMDGNPLGKNYRFSLELGNIASGGENRDCFLEGETLIQSMWQSEVNQNSKYPPVVGDGGLKSTRFVGILNVPYRLYTGNLVDITNQNELLWERALGPVRNKQYLVYQETYYRR